jgi:hypothetical protein
MVGILCYDGMLSSFMYVIVWMVGILCYDGMLSSFMYVIVWMVGILCYSGMLSSFMYVILWNRIPDYSYNNIHKWRQHTTVT